MPKDIETKIREIKKLAIIDFLFFVREGCHINQMDTLDGELALFEVRNGLDYNEKDESLVKALLTPDVDEKDTIRMIIDRIEMWADDGLIKTTEDIVKRLESIDSSLKPSNKPDVEELKKEAVKGFIDGYKRYLKDRAGFKGMVCALLTSNKDSQAYWDLEAFSKKFEEYLKTKEKSDSLIKDKEGE